MKYRNFRPATGNVLALSLAVFLLFACNNKKHEQARLPEVKIVKVIKKDTPIYEEYVGQIYGLKDIPIRARVEGFIEGLFFNEGMAVKKGQLLYTIDPDPFLAEVATKKSKLAEAQTMLVNAENELSRYKPLAEIDAVSKSDLDAAQAERDAAAAAVEAARASLDLAKIRLSYTKVRSPISGLIGKTEAREGEFVGKSPNPIILNTVSRIDTMRVQFFLSENDYLSLIKFYVQQTNKKKGSDQVATHSYMKKYNLDLILADQSIYPYKGKVDFINRNVDPKTGSMLVQAHFPNPDGILRPGLYAKIKALVEMKRGALLIPQRCVTELQGQYSVFVMEADSTVAARQIKVGERLGDLWLINEGLSENDMVLIEGIQKVTSGTKVTAKLSTFESKINETE